MSSTDQSYDATDIECNVSQEVCQCLYNYTTTVSVFMGCDELIWH